MGHGATAGPGAGDREGMLGKSTAAMGEHDRMTAGLRDILDSVVAAAELIAASLRDGGKVLICGNGGSAADAQHIAAEFLGRFLKERPPLSAIALHGNTSAMTAIGNDYGFDDVYARQVRAHGKAGDVLVAISTSGQSQNVIRAAQVARECGVGVIGLVGPAQEHIAPECDICLGIPAESTPRIQEGHILVGHMICMLVEDSLYPQDASGAQ